jgi:uncharacterized repeat protein (TIGR03803 family)
VGPTGAILTQAWSSTRQGISYGTTYSGGSSGTGNCDPYTYGCGVVYKISTAGLETVLHSFTGGADGANPRAGVIFGGTNLYGTTTYGGTGCSSGCGVVYKMNTAGVETVLHNFVGPDGAYPYAGVILDSAGNLYGTTWGGGPGGAGAVYEVEAAGSMITLCGFAGGVDGGLPYAGVTRDSAGSLYGTTYAGGTSGSGVVYELIVTADSCVENVLYNFTGGADGGQPYAGLIRGSNGDLYGTTYSGGKNSTGVVFRLTP